eukprot:COSAG01_NODE_13149_length_1628_cov_2.449313_1_plen_80_part_00
MVLGQRGAAKQGGGARSGALLGVSQILVFEEMGPRKWRVGEDLDDDDDTDLSAEKQDAICSRLAAGARRRRAARCSQGR